MTPAERYKYYQQALEKIKADVGNTICYWLVKLSGVPIEDFVEFVALKPAGYTFDSSFWWRKDEEGQVERINALETCMSKSLLEIINQANLDQKFFPAEYPMDESLATWLISEFDITIKVK